MASVELVIDKLVHGGQGIGTAEDGRKVFAWNALPGERVIVEVKKSKKGYLEGVATTILEPSSERIEPRDEAYLSTSPWQITTFEAENRFKQQILVETLSREHVQYSELIPFYSSINILPQSPESAEGKRAAEFTSAHRAMRKIAGFSHYRNKMEYSFWGDDDGLHLALFHRASHGKRIVTGSSIAMPIIDEVASKVVAVLNSADIRASQLKTIVVRANQKGEAVAALFARDEHFPEVPGLAGICKGLAAYYSNPKSPASVLTRELYVYGNVTLTDTVLGRDIEYDVNSFFQVNLPVFEMAGQRIKTFVQADSKIVDMYAGVGTIGIGCGATTLVELDPHNIAMAKRNVGRRSQDVAVVHASTETALDHIASDATIIFDPPRAGLHQKVVDRIRDAKPPKIAYLSCNPITQARDLALLQDTYKIEVLEGYNFFPRTPHIESLALLQLR
jgi:23S rRNA (uracil1939-C5)-methyltransferase